MDNNETKSVETEGATEAEDTIDVPLTPTEKVERKLQNWCRWGHRMQRLHSIHEEISDKVATLRKSYEFEERILRVD